MEAGLCQTRGETGTGMRAREAPEERGQEVQQALAFDKAAGIRIQVQKADAGPQDRKGTRVQPCWCWSIEDVQLG